METVSRSRGYDVELGESQLTLARWILRRLPAEHRQELADRFPAAAVVLWAEQQPELTAARIRHRWGISRSTAYRWLQRLEPTTT